MKILIRWLFAALLGSTAALAAAQQSPLPCVAGSPTQRLDEAIWKKVREIDHVVAYARYVRMLSACHGETAIRRIRELQDEAIRSFTFSIQESGHNDVMTAGNGDALGNAARTSTLMIVKGRFNTTLPVGPDGQPAATLKYRCTFWTGSPANIEPADRRDGEDCGWMPDSSNSTPNKPALNMLSAAFFAAGRIGSAVAPKVECQRETNWPPEWKDCVEAATLPGSRITRLRVSLTRLEVGQIADGPTSDKVSLCDGNLAPNDAGLYVGDIEVRADRHCTISGGIVLGHVRVGKDAAFYNLGASVLGNVVATGAAQVRFNVPKDAPPRQRQKTLLATADKGLPPFVAGSVELRDGRLVDQSVFVDGLLIGRDLNITGNTATNSRAAVVLCTTNWCKRSIIVGGRIGIRENGDNVTLQINNTFSYGNLNCVGNKQPVTLPDNRDSDLADPALKWPARNVVTRQSFDECAGFAQPWTASSFKGALNTEANAEPADGARANKPAKAERAAKAKRKHAA